MWGEVRCSACIARYKFSRIMFRFRLGSIATDGCIEVRCRDCGNVQKLTSDNHNGDGVGVFVSHAPVSKQEARMP